MADCCKPAGPGLSQAPPARPLMWRCRASKRPAERSRAFIDPLLPAYPGVRPNRARLRLYGRGGPPVGGSRLPGHGARMPEAAAQPREVHLDPLQILPRHEWDTCKPVLAALNE